MFERRPRPPVPGLLAPAWLLTGYRLSSRDETTVAGRAGIVVTRDGADGTRGAAWSCRTVAAVGSGRALERVSAVVDVELGILLRCELAERRGTVGVTEFLGSRSAARLIRRGSARSRGASSAAGRRGGRVELARGSRHGGAQDGGRNGGGRDRRGHQVRAQAARGSVRRRDRGGPGRRDAGRRAVPALAATGGRGRTRDGGCGRGGGGCGRGGRGGGGGADGWTPVGDEVLDLLYRGGLGPPVQRAAV